MEAQVGAEVGKRAVVGIDTQVKVEIEVGVDFEYFISRTIQIITNHYFG